MLHTQVMVRKTITFSIDTEVHREIEEDIRLFIEMYGSHKKNEFYTAAFVLLIEHLKSILKNGGY